MVSRDRARVPGASTPDGGYTVARLAADVRAVLDRLGVRRAVLVGHSISGAVISEFAHAFPDRLRAAVYLDAAFDFGPAYRASRARPFGPPAPPADTAAAVRAWVKRYDVPSPALDADARQIERLDSAEVARRLALLGPLATEVRARPQDLSAVRVSALAVCAVGSFDRAYGWLAPDSARSAAARAYVDTLGIPLQRRACDHFRRTVPRGRVVELESGHFVFVDRRADVVRAMRAFLARLPDA